MRKTVFDLVDQERERQNRLWGKQNHTPAIWCLILSEEMGEVAKEANDIYFKDISTDNYAVELVQVAAVAVAALENYLENKDGQD